MLNKLKQTIKKQMPKAEVFIKLIVRTAFRLLQLVVMAWAVMHFVDAAEIIKYAVAGIVVFATAYFSYWK